MSKLFFATVLSLLFHAGFLAGYCLLADFRPFQTVDRPVIHAKFVKLGEKRDEKLLPRKEAEPVAAKKEPQKEPEKIVKKPEPAKKIVQKPVPPSPSPRPAPSKEREKKVSAADRLASLSKNWKQQGDQKGSELGMDLTGDLALTYEQQVAELIRRTYELPSILSFQERKKLAVFVKLLIAANGKLADIQVVKKSDSAIFDNAVLAGAKAVQSFGPPPLPLRKFYAREGLTIQFCPVVCD